MNAPTIERRTMNRGRSDEFDRLFLTCPHGHDVGSVPTTSRYAPAWERGDFSNWSCGYGSCPWDGDLACGGTNSNVCVGEGCYGEACQQLNRPA